MGGSRLVCSAISSLPFLTPGPSAQLAQTRTLFIYKGLAFWAMGPKSGTLGKGSLTLS